TLAEHQDVAERVATEAIGAVQATGDLAGGIETGHGGRRRRRIDADAAHGVVAGGADLHGLLGDVHRRARVELLVHRGQLALDVVGAAVGDVEVGAAVRRPPARPHLILDGSRYHGTRAQLLL